MFVGDFKKYNQETKGSFHVDPWGKLLEDGRIIGG